MNPIEMLLSHTRSETLAEKLVRYLGLSLLAVWLVVLPLYGIYALII